MRKIKPNKKCEHALRKLKAVHVDYDKIAEQLKSTKIKLEKIINYDKKYDLINFGKLKEFIKINQSETQFNCPFNFTRINFKIDNILFYINFSITIEEDEEINELKGHIIYGFYIDNISEETVKYIEGNGYKDYIRIKKKRDDKPLIKFSINSHGLIQSEDEFEDKWWNEKDEDLLELHYRAIVYIWKKALDHVNENILP